jgi:hypothetical protein
MPALLDKFQSLKLDSLDLISESDRLFVAQTQQEYLGLLDNLNQWKEVLEKHGAVIQGTDYYQVGDDFGVEKDTKHKLSPNTWYKSLLFSNAFGLHYIKNEFEHARYTRKEVLVDYFKKKYYLDFQSDISILYEIDTPAQVIDYILHMVGSTSFGDAGLQQMFTSFKRDFTDACLIGKTITFPEVWFSRETSPTYSPENHNAKILLLALSYFESGKNEVLGSLDSFLEGVQVGERCAYQGEKFSGLKCFKNRKLELYFHDSIAAEAFYNLFHLN